jgi:hypothetical protein
MKAQAVRVTTEWKRRRNKKEGKKLFNEGSDNGDDDEASDETEHVTE